MLLSLFYSMGTLTQGVNDLPQVTLEVWGTEELSENQDFPFTDFFFKCLTLILIVLKTFFFLSNMSGEPETPWTGKLLYEMDVLFNVTAAISRKTDTNIN